MLLVVCRPRSSTMRPLETGRRLDRPWSAQPTAYASPSLTAPSLTAARSSLLTRSLILSSRERSGRHLGLYHRRTLPPSSAATKLTSCRQLRSCRERSSLQLRRRRAQTARAALAAEAQVAAVAVAAQAVQAAQAAQAAQAQGRRWQNCWLDPRRRSSRVLASESSAWRTRDGGAARAGSSATQWQKVQVVD